MDIKAIFDAYLDDELTEDQSCELAAWLAESADNVDLFVAECRMDSCLQDVLREEQLASDALARSSDSSPDTHPSGRSAGSVPSLTLAPPIDPGSPSNAFGVMAGYAVSGWPAAYLVATLVIGLGLLIGAQIEVSSPNQPDGHSVAAKTTLPHASPTLLVGRITGMVDCRWDNDRHPSSVILHPSPPVSLGDTFALAAGLLEITYDSGAKVILQGPCTYEVESRAGGYLSLGKLTARVEAGNDEYRMMNDELRTRKNGIQHAAFNIQRFFAIRTPTAVVTDLGTEFGVEVGKDGHTTSHVFQGVVEMQPIGAQGQAVRLTVNESACVASVCKGEVATVRRMAADPAAFVGPRQFVKAAQQAQEKQELKPFHRWQAYSQELRRDPSLVAYYDFQQRQGSPSLLSNVAESSKGLCDGVIENLTWGDGRFPGKQALQFSSPTGYVSVNLPQKLDDLTLAAWVFVESLDNLRNGLLMSDQWGQQGLIHWQLWDDGCGSFCISGHPDFPTTPIFDRAQFGRWTHIAVAYDHAVQVARFYHDGHSLGGERLGEHTSISIGPARIGNWNAGRTGANTVRNFHGRIDELAVFGRALSIEEIRAMYAAGKPVDLRDSPSVRLNEGAK